MAQAERLRRYFDNGLVYASLTQARAEAIVKDLVHSGEVRAESAREAVSELLERSRKGAERLTELVRREVSSQVSGLGLATKDDLADIEARLGRLEGGSKAGRPSTAGRRSTTATTATTATARGRAAGSTGVGSKAKRPAAKASGGRAKAERPAGRVTKSTPRA